MSIDFSKRSSELELMDMPIESKDDLFTNLNELNFINQWTGGPLVTFSKLKELLRHQKDEIHIVEIGFGGGDLLNTIFQKLDELSCRIKVTAIDLMPEAKEFTLMKYPHLAQKVNFVIGDYKTWFNEGNKADVIVAGLFCHHLSDEELVDFFGLVKNKSKLGTIINDLHRSPIAYYFIKIVTQLFSKSKFTKNDAPLSVLRSFKRNDFESLLQKAMVKKYTIRWKWAYRYLLIIEPEP